MWAHSLCICLAEKRLFGMHARCSQQHAPRAARLALITCVGLVVIFLCARPVQSQKHPAAPLGASQQRAQPGFQHRKQGPTTVPDAERPRTGHATQHNPNASRLNATNDGGISITAPPHTPATQAHAPERGLPRQLATRTVVDNSNSTRKNVTLRRGAGPESRRPGSARLRPVPLRGGMLHANAAAAAARGEPAAGNHDGKNRSDRGGGSARRSGDEPALHAMRGNTRPRSNASNAGRNASATQAGQARNTDASDRASVDAPSPVPPHAGAAGGPVPRIIHHMHKDLAALSASQALLRNVCAAMHPDWELKFWDDTLLAGFIAQRFPWCAARPSRPRALHRGDYYLYVFVLI